MFRTAVEKELKEAVTRWQDVCAQKDREIARLISERKLDEREKGVAIEEALSELRAEMQKRLIESDIACAEATAKLEVYQSIDTKDEREHLKQTVNKLVDAVGKIGTPKIIGRDEE